MTDKKYSSTAETPPIISSAKPTTTMNHGSKINLLIDIENSLKAKDSLGYQRWAAKFNLQQAAETMLFLQTNNLTDMEDLYQTATQAKRDYDTVQNYMAVADARIKEVNTLQRHIGAYNKNRDVYSEYLRSKRNPKFRQENEKAIVTVEEAKAYFNSLGLEKLPSIKELQAEYSALSQERLHNSQRKAELSRYISDLESARKNIELLLGIEPQRNNQQRKNNRSADVR